MHVLYLVWKSNCFYISLLSRVRNDLMKSYCQWHGGRGGRGGRRSLLTARLPTSLLKDRTLLAAVSSLGYVHGSVQAEPKIRHKGFAIKRRGSLLLLKHLLVLNLAQLWRRRALVCHVRLNWGVLNSFPDICCSFQWFYRTFQSIQCVSLFVISSSLNAHLPTMLISYMRGHQAHDPNQRKIQNWKSSQWRHCSAGCHCCWPRSGCA